MEPWQVRAEIACARHDLTRAHDRWVEWCEKTAKVNRQKQSETRRTSKRLCQKNVFMYMEDMRKYAARLDSLLTFKFPRTPGREKRIAQYVN